MEMLGWRETYGQTHSLGALRVGYALGDRREQECKAILWNCQLFHIEGVEKHWLIDYIQIFQR